MRDILHLDKDSVRTISGRGSNTTYSDSYYVFKKYSDTVLFSQPHRGSEYTVDPIAQNVIQGIYSEEPLQKNG